MFEKKLNGSEEEKRASLGGLFFKLVKGFVNNSSLEVQDRVKNLLKKAKKNRYKRQHQGKKEKKVQNFKNLLETFENLNVS